MSYANYAFYADRYYGDIIDEEDFDRYAERATDYIDYLTMGKSRKLMDGSESDDDYRVIAVRKCCCALADQYVTIENARARAAKTNGEIQSESVGSHSRSFRSGAETIKDAAADLSNTARQYLLPTGLLYRGGVSCVHTACRNGL